MSKKQPILVALTAILLASLAEMQAGEPGMPGAEDYVRLFPNDGNCVYPVRGLLRRWPDGGPRELWRLQIGEGKAAVVEARGRAFTGYQADGKQWAACLDPSTGRTLWTRMLIAKENHHGVEGMVSTPIVDGNHVYFIPYDSNKGNLWDPHCPIFCLNASDGAVIWEERERFTATEGGLPLIEAGKSGYKELGRVNPEIKMGLPQQPTIFGNRLYLRCNNTIVCYQADSHTKPPPEGASAKKPVQKEPAKPKQVGESN